MVTRRREGPVAHTITFPTSGPLPSLDDLAGWLTEQGEPHQEDGPDQLSLRSLPLRLVHDGRSVRAQLDLQPTTPLSRLTRVVFDLSVRLGADVKLVGAGEVTRPAMWLRLADEQDRLRLAAAIDKAGDVDKRDQVLTGLWSLLGSIAPGRDLRWDLTRAQIVEIKEVGAPGGISVEEASWFDADASTGDAVAVPQSGDVHVLAFRWMSEAYPSLVET